MRNGPFYPDHGLERIVEYHERQDARFAEAAAELSERPASRSSPPPSWRSPIRPTPVRPPCGPPAGSAIRAATGPSWRSATSIATPGTGHAARPDVPPSPRPPISPIVVLTVLALIPAVLLWSVWRWADGRAASAEDRGSPASETPVAVPEPAPALATTLLSYRRAAGELSRDLNLAAFEQAVQPLLDMVGDRSCAAISVNGRMVASKNADTAVIPASNTKNLIAAAALEVLGPDFTYTTRVVGPEPEGGVVARRRLPRRGRRPAALGRLVRHLEPRALPGVQRDFARRPRPAARRQRRDHDPGVGAGRRLPLRRRVLHRQLGRSTWPASRRGRTTR
jgi:hypothetical protein